MPTLSVFDSLKLLQKYGIPVVEHELVHHARSLGKAGARLGYPLAMKITSSRVSHKTEVGGIKLNIHTLKEAKKAFSELAHIPGFEAALVQKQLKGTELIVGGKQDPQFGPTVIFGMGGVFVEVFKDASVRVCPIKKKDADEMIKEIKGYSILTGFRGEKKANIHAIKKTIINANKIMLHENIKELDINPLIANNSGAIAVDARIVI